MEYGLYPGTTRGLGLQDPQGIQPAAHVSSFAYASAAAAKYGQPQGEISHSDLLALSGSLLATSYACPFPPPPLWAVAPRDFADHELRGNCTQQNACALLPDEVNSSKLEETLSPHN